MVHQINQISFVFAVKNFDLYFHIQCLQQPKGSIKSQELK